MDYFERLLELSDLNTDRSLGPLEEMYSEEEFRAFLKEIIWDKHQRDNLSEVVENEIDDLATLPDDTPNINLPAGDGSEIVVRRYLDTAKFTSFLTDGIWFGRLSNFSDSYEGRSSEEAVRNWMDIKEFAVDEEPVAPYDLADLKKAREEINRNQSLVSCWRYGGNESSVFWNAYIDGTDGLAIETTLDKLKSQMEAATPEILIGKVRYKQYKGTRERHSTGDVERVFTKRFAFEDEQELRLVMRRRVNDFELTLNGRQFSVDLAASPGIQVDIDPNELIDRLILPPGASDRDITRIVQIAEYHGIDAEILRSHLDISPGRTASVHVDGDNAGEIADEDMTRARSIDKSEYKK